MDDEVFFCYDIVPSVLKEAGRFGRGTWGAGQSVNVEYVSANPTGPLHIGHGRIAIVGDIIANLLDAVGFKVTREYYINDMGAQVDVLARSVYRRYVEACGQSVANFPEEGYPGDYLIPIAHALKDRDGQAWLDKSADQWMPIFKDFAIQEMMADIRASLKRIGIHLDVFSSEKSVCERGLFEKAKDILSEKDLVLRGTLPPPKGKKADDWKPVELLLFKASLMGEPQDAALQKPDGSLTYFGGDVAYHQDKLSRDFDRLINIWGADHAAQVGRLRSAVNVLSGHRVDLSFVLCQMVHVLKDGEPLKMSKRAGNYVCLDDVVTDVGADVLRFIMVTRETNAQLTFDVDTVTKTSTDNPVFYVHYAYARSHSVLRAAQEMFGQDFVARDSALKADLFLLTSEPEQALIQKMAFWPDCVEGAAQTLQPHRIATFLINLAGDFHKLWSQGHHHTTLRFLEKDAPAVSSGPVALIIALQDVLKAGFDILGIDVRERLDWYCCLVYALFHADDFAEISH